MKTTMLKSKKPDFSFIHKEVGQIKNLNSKFFSFSLMWEGIKHTKTLGICFLIFTIIAACCIPVLKMIQYAGMSSDLVSQQPTEEVALLKFSLPILAAWIIFPIILVISLFKFMNERAASDFYHSIPLGRTCIYITYSVSVFLWGVAAILTSTVLSYICYLIGSHYFMIPVSFMGTTILASIIAMFLSMSATLLAKGLSGTGFSNAVIAILIMYAPRAIILVFAHSVINAVQVATITGIGFVDPTLNILLTPFVLVRMSEAITSPSTLWYSLILGIVYYVLGLLAHKFRKSETAGKSSCYKGVQHVVRSIFGIIPLLVICYYLATRDKLSAQVWVICIAISIIMYFLYELATTRSGKKLLIAIPMYLIVIGFSGLFVLSSLTISNSIMDDIPEVSEIESVSISNINDSSYALGKNSYYNIKYANYELKNKEIIKILHESLVDNVNIIKSNESIYTTYNNGYETCTVTFHTESGRNLERKICIDTKKYFGESDTSGLIPYICKDEEYSEIFTNLPSNDEIMSIIFENQNGYLDNSINTINHKYIDELWSTFRVEFANMSKEDKLSLMFYPYTSDGEYAGFFIVSGYVRDGYFQSQFHINSSLTPKTYSKIVDIKNDVNRENFKTSIIDTITKDTDINIWAGYMGKYFGEIQGNTLFYLECKPEKNKALANGYFDELKKVYNFNFDSTKYSDEVKEILNMIYENSKNNFDVSDTYPIVFSIYHPVYYREYDYTNYEYMYMYANLSEEQYKRIAKIYEELAKEGTEIKDIAPIDDVLDFTPKS